MFTRIAVAFDESAESQRAYHTALELAQLTSAQIFLITVIERLPAYISYVATVAPEVPRLLKDERRSFYTDLQAQAINEARLKNVIVKGEIAEGDEIGAILTLLAKVQPNLLAVGLKQDGILARMFGGTSHQLAIHATCDVLGIR